MPQCAMSSSSVPFETALNETASCVDGEYEALMQFLYMAPIGLVQVRHDGEIMLVNPLCSQLLMPLSRDGELANLFTVLEPVAPDLRSRVKSFERTHGMICDGVHLYVNRSCSDQRPARILSLTLLKLDDARLMGVVNDVTQAIKRERELRQSQAWIHTIATGLTDYALTALDGQGRIKEWNSSVYRVTGYDKAASIGHSYSLFYPPDPAFANRAADRLQEADHAGWSLDEGWRVRADGTRFWGSCLIAPLHLHDDTPMQERAYSLIVRDISDRREASEALRKSVSCDHLTGVANRRALFEAAELELGRWVRAPRPLSLVLIDADHFKKVNDQYGHAAGDAVLRHLAAGMSATFRIVDVIARLGGEEFVVLLPNTTLDDAHGVAERLCRKVAAQPVEVDGQLIHYTISAGVASMEQELEDIDGLIQRADVAMYAAKSNGRNCVERWNQSLPMSKSLRVPAEPAR